MQLGHLGAADNGDGEADSGADAHLNAATHAQPRLARLTPEERERLFQENKCFRCRKAGHKAIDCPLGQRRPFLPKNSKGGQ